MESWILYYDSTYEALPWPYRQTWEDVVHGDVALRGGCEDFGVVSPTDYSTEVPSVPPNLPRGVPKGRYAMGVYHDERYLYVMLDTAEGPVVVTPEMFKQQVQVPKARTAILSLMVMTADEQYIYHFSREADGDVRFRVSSARHGPRSASLPDVSVEWQYQEEQRRDGERAGWRLSRDSLDGVLAGQALRLSLSRTCFRSHEYVAWGGGFMWGPRPDEMGTVQLVTERGVAPCPICRRMELAYDPQHETGWFRTFWRDLYRADERIDGPIPQPWEPYRHACSLRLNGRQQHRELAPEVETDELPIPDGHSFVEASSAGETSVRLYIEKRSGNRIAPCPYPPPPALSSADFLAQVRRETTDAHERLLARLARNEPFDLADWPMYQAASAGRVHAWIEQDPRLLEILRTVADEALALQREDGTFSGFHLSKHRRAKGEAPRWAGGAYDTGQAGELWAVAAWMLGDEKYLAASQRLLHAYEQYRIEFNQNYAAFTLYHLSTHYRLTRDPLALEHGLYYARNLAAVNILPLGYQAGHNFYTCYGFITLRGLANFCQVLPEDEPYRAELRELCLRMANQVIARLQPDGSCDARDRYQLGLRFWVSSLFGVALLVDGDDLARLDDVLQLMLRAPATTRRFACLETEVARYFVCRDRLLNGEKVDLMELV